jgi:beta-lactamase class A
MQSVFPSRPAVFSPVTCVALRHRRTMVAVALACPAWLSHAGNMSTTDQVIRESATNLVAGTSGSNDPVQRRKELSDALEKAAEAERRLNQKAEQLNADMARLLNQAETQQLLQPAPILERRSAPAPDEPLRLRMDRALAHPPEAASNRLWPTAGETGIMGALASGAAIIAAAATAWLMLRIRTLRRTEQARRKAWWTDIRLEQEKAPALLFHQSES